MIGMINNQEMFVYQDRPYIIEEILDNHYKGGKTMCHKCGSELLVLPDAQIAGKVGKRPGVYCPVSEKHVCVWIIDTNRRKEVWKRFEQLKKEREDRESQQQK